MSKEEIDKLNRDNLLLYKDYLALNLYRNNIDSETYSKLIEEYKYVCRRLNGN